MRLSNFKILSRGFVALSLFFASLVIAKPETPDLRANRASEGYTFGTLAEGICEPTWIAIDPSGALYVNCASGIERIAASGAATHVVSSEVFMNRYADGLAVDAEGNAYVGDASGIRKISPRGDMRTLVPASSRGTSAEIWAPLAVDSAGNLYAQGRVASGSASGSHALSGRIEKISQSGSVVVLPAVFGDPEGIAVAGDGTIYVADADRNNISRIDPTGAVSVIAGPSTPDREGRGPQGKVDVIGGAARFNGPAGLALDRAGNLYVMDIMNYAVRKIAPTGRVTTLASNTGFPGNPNAGNGSVLFSVMFSVAVDNAGRVYVADCDNNAVRVGSPAYAAADDGFYATKTDRLAINVADQ